MIMLEATHLNKTYRGTTDVPVLNDVNLSIHKGELVAIIGASGSGKSTLLHILAGVEEADRGEVCIQGTAFSDLSQDERTIFRRRNIGLIYQFFNLIPSLTVEKNIQLPMLIVTIWALTPSGALSHIVRHDYFYPDNFLGTLTFLKDYNLPLVTSTLVMIPLLRLLYKHRRSCFRDSGSSLRVWENIKEKIIAISGSSRHVSEG